MADIRNDQYLHRPGAGRGAVTPTDPMEVRLFGSNGQPLSTTDGKIDVRATELEALIGEVRESPSANTLLARLKTLADTLGTEATLQAIKIALDSLSTKDYATQATLAEVLSRLEAIEQRLDSGEAKVQLTGHVVELYKYEGTPGAPISAGAALEIGPFSARDINRVRMYFFTDSTGLQLGENGLRVWLALSAGRTPFGSSNYGAFVDITDKFQRVRYSLSNMGRAVVQTVDDLFVPGAVFSLFLQNLTAGSVSIRDAYVAGVRC